MVEALTNREGKVLDYTNSTGNTVSGGTVVQISGKAAVTVTDVLDTKLVAASIEGIYNIQKKALAFTDQQKIYWDENGDPVGGTAGSGAATNVAADGDFELGICIGAVGSGVARAPVQLNMDGDTGVDSKASDVIADPGDAGAIPVTGSGYVAIVTVAAETRTLADPTFAGQILVLSLKTDGGDCVLTAASPINQQGDTVFTFNDAGDALILVAVEDGGSIEWRIAGIDGVAGVTGPATLLGDTIADPGDAGAIPVTGNGTCNIVSAAAETRTISNPTFAGQQLLVTLKTDGGTVTVTVASTVNQTGNNTLTMADQDDSILLVGVDSNGTLEWRIALNDTVALSTV